MVCLGLVHELLSYKSDPWPDQTTGAIALSTEFSDESTQRFVKNDALRAAPVLDFLRNSTWQ
jgi:hypothetical protein